MSDQTLYDEIEALRRELDDGLGRAASVRDVDDVRVRFFGRKGGAIPALFGRLKSVPPDEKKQAGEAINGFRSEVETRIEARKSELATGAKPRAGDIIDVTLPARPATIGHLHPVTVLRRRLEAIFRDMGYTIASGPEIESDWYNFEALNFPPDHPARDTQDTFYLGPELLLRTHTSNTQIHQMESFKPPLKVVAAGRVFRKDEITLRRSPMFHQIEGFIIDRGIHFGHLRGTLEHVIRRLFGEDVTIRFRPSFFPFTEPSAEVDMGCIICHGEGCGTCSQTGWLEILGCGMVHPNVLRNVGIDPEEWTGFAFGIGIDRVAMRMYGLPNIRTLFENDLRVLEQF